MVQTIKLDKGPKLWEKAKEMIPGGNQLLSKRSELFLPKFWPSYYDKAKGCELWDLDSNHYYDFLQMGVSACILGYADPDVDNKVKEAINKGQFSTLNSWEEVELSKKLISLHPWSDMVRYARTGGEACAIAVRIGRAFSGKEKVAFCGYHGWHDWYLASNISCATNLDQQLLKGLEPKGVPSSLSGTALPFNYNNFRELENIVNNNKNEIGVIIMEVERSTDPKEGFLENIRSVANEIGAVLIFDEITSGFKTHLGGVHMKYNIEPDIAIFGKALGNGYPISAILGKKDIMDNAQDSFISSTFWTERLGFVAALATIEKMEQFNVINKLNRISYKIRTELTKISKKHNVPLEIGGHTLMYLSFNHSQAQEIMTYYTQEMLSKGFLAGASICSTIAYTDKLIEKFIANTEIVFNEIGKNIKINTDFNDLLIGPVKHSGFKRLTT
jgi:glutamate-1-semialdehyde 2,1-aminomutase